jgi:hypothetical protein
MNFLSNMLETDCSDQQCPIPVAPVADNGSEDDEVEVAIQDPATETSEDELMPFKIVAITHYVACDGDQIKTKAMLVLVVWDTVGGRAECECVDFNAADETYDPPGFGRNALQTIEGYRLTITEDQSAPTWEMVCLENNFLQGSMDAVAINNSNQLKGDYSNYERAEPHYHYLVDAAITDQAVVHRVVHLKEGYDLPTPQLPDFEWDRDCDICYGHIVGQLFVQDQGEMDMTVICGDCFWGVENQHLFEPGGADL